MFKKSLFIMSAVIIVIIGGAIAILAKGKQSSAPAKHPATKLVYNGPWTDISTNAGTIHLIQEVHNGNEIYYSISNNDPNTKLFHKEIKAWNDLGVVKLVQVPWKNKKSEIVLHTVNHYLNNQKDEDGYNIDGNYSYKDITFSTSTDLNAKPNGIMHGGTVTLFKSFSEMADKEQQANLVRHEIGHALGFAHDNRTVKIGWETFHLTMHVTMNDSVHIYNKLGGVEQRTLSARYNIKPKDGDLKTNY